MASSPEYEDRIRELEKRYALNPGSLVFAQLADLYRKSGNPGRALEVLEEGLANHPDYLSAHIVLGRTCRDTGDVQDAVAAFSRVLELDRENLVALRSLGDMARERGDLEEAGEWYERILDADPLNEEVQEILDGMDPSGAPEAGGTEPGAEATGGSADVGEADRSFEPGVTLDFPAEDEASSGELAEETGQGPDGDRESPGGDAETADGEEAEPDDSESVPEPFRMAAEAAVSGPEGDGVEEAGAEPGDDPGIESEAAGVPDESDEDRGIGHEVGTADDAGVAADEAVNRAFDAVESWRRETEEADAAREAAESGREEAPPAETEDLAEPSAEGDGGTTDEEALAAAWEEAYREEPSAPAEADEATLGHEEEITSGEEMASGEEAASGEEVAPDREATRAEEVAPVEEARPDEEEIPDDATIPDEVTAELREEAEDEQPDDEVFTETLAGLYARQGFYTEAVEIYEELLRRRPHDETLRQRMESARESRERTGERLTAETPPSDPGDAGGDPDLSRSAPEGEGKATAASDRADANTGRGSVSIEEHLRALLRGEAPVGFAAGAAPVEGED